MTNLPERADFPLITSDKLRYGDTDMLGHVNNAVFATLLETGRVEFACDPARPLAREGASFVLARLVVDFRAELTWPGQVDIGTGVESVGSSSIRLRQALFQAGRCVATAESVIVQMDEVSRRATPLSEAARARLAGLTMPG